jgi:hypothetical protein
VTLLARVTAFLAEHHVANALIGAAALAAHGVSRSTLDQDLLVTDVRVLAASFWQALAAEAEIDVRRGDTEDPLAGVVRIACTGERDVDVVVGRHHWQHEVLSRAHRLGDEPMYVVDKADLILLKLYAGGIQDRWDIEQLLALDAREEAIAMVDDRIAALPAHSRELWASLRRS